MPGLKFEEWESWDTKNLSNQEKIVEANVIKLQESLWEVGLDQNTYKKLREKYDRWKTSPLAVTQIATTRKIFELQRDLGVLEYFIRVGFGESVSELDFEDKNGLKGQVERIMADQNVTSTFPQIVEDAITAIKTDGHQPPAEEMQKAQDYFASRVVVAIGETELNVLSTEDEQYNKAVDDARTRVDNRFSQGKIDQFQAYDLETEIDTIMSEKEPFTEKIGKLSKIAQN